MTTNNGHESDIVIPYLRAWRLWLGLSQYKVEKLVGLPRQTVRAIEEGKRVRRNHLARLEAGLGISEYELLHTPPEED